MSHYFIAHVYIRFKIHRTSCFHNNLYQDAKINKFIQLENDTNNNNLYKLVLNDSLSHQK